MIIHINVKIHFEVLQIYPQTECSYLLASLTKIVLDTSVQRYLSYSVFFYYVTNGPFFNDYFVDDGCKTSSDKY